MANWTGLDGGATAAAILVRLTACLAADPIRLATQQIACRARWPSSSLRVSSLERPEQGVDCARGAAGDRMALSQRAQGYDYYGSCQSLRRLPEHGDSDRGGGKDRDLQEGPCGSPAAMTALAVNQRPYGRCAGFRLHESQDRGLTNLVSTRTQGTG